MSRVTRCTSWYLTLRSEGSLSKVVFSINRSDYLLHVPASSSGSSSSTAPCIKQVEFNSIAGGGRGLMLGGWGYGFAVCGLGFGV